MSTDELITRARHARTESPLQPADRLISELRNDHLSEAWHHPKNPLYCHRVIALSDGDVERVMSLGMPVT